MDVALIVLVVRLLTDACKKIVPIGSAQIAQTIALFWSVVLTLGYDITVLPPAQIPYLSQALTIAAVWLAAMGANDLLDRLSKVRK